MTRHPEPVMSVSVQPRSKEDELAMALALKKLAKDDAAFRVRTDPENGEVLLEGTGELHLEILVDRLKRRFAVDAKIGAPKVAYKETIRKPVTEEAVYIRGSGAGRHYARCTLKLEPRAAGAGFHFASRADDAAVPPPFVDAVERGVKDALSGGTGSGHQLVDVGVTLEGGAFEPGSDALAFKIAGGMALRSGCRKAEPVLLEPVMRCEVVVPSAALEAVAKDLEARGAVVEETASREKLKAVTALVPLARMFGYAAALRELSKGRASFTLKLSHFAPCS